jgi:nucleoside-diphosphate-sugar epimerase
VIVVTGASSFVGAHTVRALGALGVVHQTPLAGTTTIALDLRLPEAADRLVELNPRVIVHLACKVRDPGANEAMLATVLAACRRASASLVHGSTTQVHWSRLNRYARGRAQEEATIAASGVPYVILRPCAPYGPPLADHAPRHVETFQRLADAVVRWPIVPIPGSGRQLRQPIHVRDFADVVGRCAALSDAVRNRTFDVGGPRAMSMLALVDKLALAAGRKIRPMPVPIAAMKLASRFVAGLDPDLVSTLDCDDEVDPGPISDAIGKHDWVRFEIGARDLVAPGWSTR